MSVVFLLGLGWGVVDSKMGILGWGGRAHSSE